MEFNQRLNIRASAFDFWFSGPAQQLLIFGAFDVTSRTDPICNLVDLDAACAGLLAARVDGLIDVGERDLVKAQLLWRDVDLVLLHKPPNGGHLCDPRAGPKREVDAPILKRS